MLNRISCTIVKQTKNSHSGTVFFFHGSGDTGPGILDWVKFLVGDFSLPHIKFVFPTAPLRPYTPFNGEHAHVWFDRPTIRPDVADHLETLEPMGRNIATLIQNEVDTGVPLNKIIIGGFSMGGALALNVGYKFLPGVAGVFALSAFLNTSSVVYNELQKVHTNPTTPLLMFHGDHDDVVPIQWGRNTFNKLSELNVDGEFVPLRNTMHELKKKELETLLDWIVKKIPS